MKGIHFKHAVLPAIDPLGILAVGNVLHGFMPYSSHHDHAAVGGPEMLEPTIGNRSLRLLQHQVFECRDAFPAGVSSLVVGFFSAVPFRSGGSPKVKGSGK